MNNKFFKVVADWDLKICEFMLVDVYLPIIKMETFAFYQNLKILINNNKGFSNLATFLKKNKMSETTFFDYLHKLEGVKLVDTYQDIYEDKINYFIKFNDTLSFKEILKNKSFYKRLESCLSEPEFDALNQKIHANDTLKKMVNESWTFQDAYLSSKAKPEGFQMNDLKSVLEKKVGYKIDFSDEVTEYLQNRFKDIPYDYNEIANLLSPAIVDPKSNPHISYSLMLAELDENNDSTTKIEPEKEKKKTRKPCSKTPKKESASLDSQQDLDNQNIETDQSNEIDETHESIQPKPKLKNTQPTKYVKLNRTEAIYYPDSDIDDFLDVIYDFENYDALTYISSIHCKKISDEFLMLIEDLQNRYKFNDELINILFDYCNWKTNGFFNQKYIQKTAATIFSLNIEKSKDLIAHLKNPFKKDKYISKKEKQSSPTASSNIFECKPRKKTEDHEDNGF